MSHRAIGNYRDSREEIPDIPMSVGRINSIQISRPCLFQGSSVKLPTRLCLTTALLATALGLSSCATARLGPAGGDPSKYDATVKMTGGLVAVGMGYGWGHGTISYQ